MPQLRSSINPRAPLRGTVHLWTIALNRPASVVSSLADVLDSSERAQASRLWEGPLRSRFIVAHGAARQIIAQYLDIPAPIVQLERAPGGKPRVRGSALSFNLTQSGGVAVCAISNGGRLGVDVEQIRSISNADAMAERMFAPGEVRQYVAMPPADRQAAWFSCWTRKEAFLKATGELHQRALDSFEVDLSPGASNPRVTVQAEKGWWMRSFSPGQGYVGAVAGDFPIAGLSSFEWTTADENAGCAARAADRDRAVAFA